MSEPAMQCPKCQGSMEQGFVLDCTYGGFFAASWVRGAPQKSFWGGLKRGTTSNQTPVGAFRCQTCGFLELYARNDFEAK